MYRICKCCFVSLIALFLFASFVSAGIEDGLVLYMPFEEGKGDVTKDLSPNGFEGTIKNPEWGEGKFGGALIFDNTERFVEIPYDTPFDIKEGITMAAWVTANLPFSPEWKVILNAKKSAQGPWGLQSRSVGNLETFYDVGGVRVWNSSVSAMEPDVFHHVAATYDSEDGFKVYFDGILEPNGANAGNLATRGLLDTPPNEGIVIGHNYGTADRYWDGAIDEVVIYNRALSEDEMAQLVEGALTKQAVNPEAKLSATWGKIKQ